MPRYELSVIFKALSKPDIVNSIKRATKTLIEEGAVVRGMENVGLRRLPHKFRSGGQWHHDGHYITMDLSSPPETVMTLQDVVRKQEDVIRANILRKEVEMYRPCEKGECDFGEMNNDKRLRLFVNEKTCIKKL